MDNHRGLQPRLEAGRIYLDAEKNIYLSTVSIWEFSIKSSLNKISLDAFVEEHIRGNNIEILDIQLAHITRIENLPFHHRDPFDRLILSQAIEDNLTIYQHS